MGKFTRQGEFRSRQAFQTALRGKLEKLRDGVLRGGVLEWSDGLASLEAFGARVVFRMNATTWSCEAELPSFLPIPVRMVEAKFDEEFSELNGL
jgi:hypothetical protein